MNSRGQSLVVFILILPVLFILISFTYKLSEATVYKIKCENEIKDVIKYGLNHIEEENLNEKLKTLLDLNIDGDKEIIIENGVITVSVKNKSNLTFTGHKENDKIIIESKWIYEEYKG